MAFILKKVAITLILDISYSDVMGSRPQKDTTEQALVCFTYFMFAFHSTVLSILLL